MEKELCKYRLLVVDDEEDICDILQFNLENAGYHVETAANAEQALAKLTEGYHLILLDIMMDGMSGLKMVELLREEYNSNIPVIFLSALDDEADILNGFDKGGDDYIPKPFSMKEVVARVKAVLQRCYAAKENKHDSVVADKFVFENLTVDYADKRVYVNGIEVLLTKKETEILMLLTKQQGKIYSRENILDLVWKNESYVLDRTVDVHIARLRKKLGEYGNMIVNRSGYGYCFIPKC
jgi:two-component system alkaline phosphatase synthesis response regulator PhoP